MRISFDFFMKCIWRIHSQSKCTVHRWKHFCGKKRTIKIQIIIVKLNSSHLSNYINIIFEYIRLDLMFNLFLKQKCFDYCWIWQKNFSTTRQLQKNLQQQISVLSLRNLNEWNMENQIRFWRIHFLWIFCALLALTKIQHRDSQWFVSMHACSRRI